MNILFYQWNAYNLYDVRLTLEQMGHKITMLSVPIDNPEEDDAYVEQLCGHLGAHRYDFLFSINFFPVLAEACHSSGVLYVCWNCDSPLLALYHESVFYPTNLIFTFDRSECETFRTLGCRNIYHLPLAVNTDRLAKQILQRKNHKYPVTFVGNLYEKNSYDKIAGKLPPYLCGYLEGAMNAQLLVSGGNLLEKLLTDEVCLMLEDIMDYHKSPRSFASVRALFSTTVLGFKAASLERFQNLNALSFYMCSNASGAPPASSARNTNQRISFTMSEKQASPARQSYVHLFTNSILEDLPFVTVHGPVDYLEEMPQIFHDSKINLNMTIPNIKTGIPLRVWDILGSGGFALSNYQPEFDDYFQAGKTLDIFEDTEELLEKTAFYLEHDSLRSRIARQGREYVAREHNYQVRLHELLKIVKQNLPYRNGD